MPCDDCIVWLLRDHGLSFLDMHLSFIDSKQMPTPATAEQSQLRIPARYYARVADLLMRDGLDVDELLRPLGLSLRALSQPGATLALNQVDLMVQAGVQMTGRSDLGFELGKALKLSSHDIVGYGILSSPNVDYALRLVARFFRLILPSFQARYRRDQRHLELTFQAVAATSQLCLDVHLEALASAAHFEIRELMQGQMPQYALHIAVDEPPHVKRYAELHEARCHFIRSVPPQVRFVLPAEAGDKPLALADDVALKAAEQRCRAMVQSVVKRQDVAGWVRMMLREARHGMPSMDEMAHTLNMSPRTLDRYLQREGFGYRALLQQVRHERAQRLLKHTDLPVTHIALELGYTDAANFTRAFRKKAGLSPSDYRAQIT